MAGWQQTHVGHFDAGLAQMEAEFPRVTAIGPFFRYYAALLAEARERCGRLDDALAVIRPAIATIAEPGVGLHISELYRVQGTCLLSLDRSHRDEAMNSLRTGVDIARRQGAKVLELAASVSLARAALGTADAQEALTALRSLCDTLPTDLATPSLDEANALLTK